MSRPGPATGPVPIEEVIALCRRLRLKYVREQAEEVLLTGRAQRWDPAEVLRALLQAESDGRDRSTMELKRRRARFPAGKTFDTWAENRSSIPAQTQRSLRSLEWVSRAENLVVAGPSGTGKSHLLEAIGHEAVDRHLSVAWFSVEDLGAVVRRHRVDDTVSKAFSQLASTSLVVVDDIGLLPISTDAAEGLYRLVDAVYERRSLALSSNLHPSGFDQLMDKTIASALVDRLLHHAHVVLTDGESVRLADATSGKGVVPLAS
ncbi:MAG TPA: IS21-like element helper ATPase IstB [Acidimicrobiales bacterium]|nr:IS21-like element helper ATPase IstB [Acidimicrobiales bacterium]